MAKNYGADDKVPCPKCKMNMYVVKRTPYMMDGKRYEAQILVCGTCGNLSDRSVDEEGNPASQLKK